MKTRFSLLIVIISFIIACGPNAEHLAEQARLDSLRKDPTEKAEQDRLARELAFPKNTDSTRKMVRTAEIKFKVKDVRNASLQIEDLTAKYNGFITYSNLASVPVSSADIDIEKDSLTHVHTYSFENEIKLRVPNIKLDSFLRSLAPLITYLDYRTIHADDISLNLLHIEKLTKRLDKFDKRMTNAIDKKGKRLYESAVAEDVVLNRQNQADANNVEQMRLMDQYNYSTVTLYLYQNQLIGYERLLNTHIWENYRPGFFKRMTEGFESGWEAIQTFIVGLAHLWAFILLGIIAYFFIQYIIKKRKKGKK